MSRISGKNTKPELIVRSLLHKLRYRFRLHRIDLPGKPDITLPKYKKVIFVHGCFWHGHKGCKKSRRPTTNEKFWNKKLTGNMQRDKRYYRNLREMGWQILIVWECETKNTEKLLHKLERL
jgi:DNA mismatch endonuclease (patch repair protein)